MTQASTRSGWDRGWRSLVRRDQLRARACLATVGLRVDEDEKQEGLDQTAHGESAYRP
jgi:hypothetical protein